MEFTGIEEQVLSITRKALEDEVDKLIKPIYTFLENEGSGRKATPFQARNKQGQFVAVSDASALYWRLKSYLVDIVLRKRTQVAINKIVSDLTNK